MPVNERIYPTSGTRIKPDGLRLLTIGEIALAKTLFGEVSFTVKYGYTEKAISPLTYSLSMLR